MSPQPAATMIRFSGKLISLISSPKRLALALTAFFMLSVLTATTVGARISVGDFEGALDSPNLNAQSQGFHNINYATEGLRLMALGCQQTDPCPDEAEQGAVHVMGNLVAGF